MTTQAYALFNNNIFSTILYYPSDGNEDFVKITAALKSNPTIIFDENSDIPTTYKYSIFVEEEYVGSLHILKLGHDNHNLEPLHIALQNNPMVVWIESDTLPTSNTRYSYENNVLTVIEE